MIPSRTKTSLAQVDREKWAVLDEEAILDLVQAAKSIPLLMQRLDARKRSVIEARFWRGETLEMIGRRMMITRERVHQIEAYALRIMRLSPMKERP